MHPHTASTARLLGVAALATGLLAAWPAVAAPAEPPRPVATSTATARPGTDEIRERVRPRTADMRGLRAAQRAAVQAASEGEGAGFDEQLVMPKSYPTQPTLRTYPVDPNDAATASMLTPYSDLAPQITEWMAGSNLVSAQVVGQSVQGRDLYLVTLTAPENAAQTAKQTAWKHEIRDNPVVAGADTALKAGYKTPIWFSANIHGNEWEGTDAQVEYISDLLASAGDAATTTLLAENRLYFYLTINPDGRTIGQRPGVLGLDINRDMITSTTPESIAFAKSAQAIQPLYSADIHGYTGVLQVEPCGPPHGDNYEYDLFIGHGYGAARRVETEMSRAVIPGNPLIDPATGMPSTLIGGLGTGKITIPYRDTPSGWDDYPPVFTAQYTAYFGAVTSTVELPLMRAANGSQSPGAGRVNTAVAKQTINSLVDYVTENSDAMLANQIEVFRRGVAGEPKVQLTRANIAAVPGPDEWKSLWDVTDDQNPVEYPRAYVIALGDAQRSRTDADRVVRHLLFNGIAVSTLDADTTLTSGGVATTYPAGSYVVDMHQPLRGLANSLLDVGYDISDKVPSMYDVSAWSYSYLWGADVDKVGLTTDAPIGATTTITEPTPVTTPEVRSALRFDLAGVPDYRALNDLLEVGADARLAPDGSVVVAAASYDAAVAAATAHGVPLRAATPAEVTAAGGAGARTLTDLTVGYTGTQDDTLGLTELGFDDLVPITGAAITATPTILDDLDVLWVGADLALADGSAGDNAVQAWVDAGHSIVGQGAGGLATMTSYGLLGGTAVTGNRSGNGIVALDTPVSSPLAPYAQNNAFIYPAVTFTAAPPDVEVAQRYAADPLLAGHWLPTTATDGPDYAGGKASALSNEVASGARALVFGTTVFFRTHPKGTLGSAGRAIFWAAAPAATPLPVSRPTVITLKQVGTATYPDGAKVRITVAPETGAGQPDGRVILVDAAGNRYRTGAFTNGALTVTLPSKRPGSPKYRAGFLPADSEFSASTTRGVSVTTQKVRSKTRTTLTKLSGNRVRLAVTVTSADPSVAKAIGPLEVLVDRETVARTTLVRTDKGVFTVVFTLSRGSHQVQAAYGGSRLLTVSRSGSREVTARS